MISNLQLWIEPRSCTLVLVFQWQHGCEEEWMHVTLDHIPPSYLGGSHGDYLTSQHAKLSILKNHNMKRTFGTKNVDFEVGQSLFLEMNEWLFLGIETAHVGQCTILSSTYRTHT